MSGRKGEENLPLLLAQVDEFQVLTGLAGLKDKITDMLREAYELGYEQASSDSCGCI